MPAAFKVDDPRVSHYVMRNAPRPENGNHAGHPLRNCAINDFMKHGFMDDLLVNLDDDTIMYDGFAECLSLFYKHRKDHCGFVCCQENKDGTRRLTPEPTPTTTVDTGVLCFDVKTWHSVGGFPCNGSSDDWYNADQHVYRRVYEKTGSKVMFIPLVGSVYNALR